MPEVGEKVTVALRWPARIVRATVSHVLLPNGDTPLGGWSADPDGPIPPSQFGPDSDAAVHDGKINMWSIDPHADEGVGWCRGWDGPAVEALKAAEALA